MLKFISLVCMTVKTWLGGSPDLMRVLAHFRQLGVFFSQKPLPNKANMHLCYPKQAGS